jgi:hypothetical protein
MATETPRSLPLRKRRAPARIVFSTRLIEADADRIDAAAREMNIGRNDLIIAMVKLVLGNPEHRAALAAMAREPVTTSAA